MKNTYKSYIHLANGNDVDINYEITDGKIQFLTIGDTVYGMSCFNLYIVLNVLKDIVYIPEKHLEILEERI